MPAPSGHSRRRARGARQHDPRASPSNGASAQGDDKNPSPMATAAAAADGAVVPPELGMRSSAQLVQDAQDAAVELKTLLGTQQPGSAVVDAVRQRARNALLAVLFGHPLSPHAQSIDTLWFNTTYALISEYRELVARIEASLPPPGTRLGPKGGSGGGGGAGGADPASDLRRTLARFRTLLRAENTFYRSLVARIVVFYRLQERTQGALALVGIPVPPASGGDDEQRDPSTAPPLSREESDKKLSMVYKGLVYLGDLERYKEQYSDKARREAREGAAPARDAERYSRAILFYEVARGLQPDNGTAFNQLAVIDGYVGDNFHCTYHYFRALAVKQPFASGRANLERVLKKAFERWRNQRVVDKDTAASEPEVYRRDLLTILSIHWLRSGTAHLPQLRLAFLDLFARLLRARQLPSETIVKTTAMVIGSHWHARFDQSPRQPDPLHANEAAKRHAIEELSLSFLLSTLTTLVTVSADEAEEVLRTTAGLDESALVDEDEQDDDEDMEHDGTLALAQRISAVVRRILPSLRIASRWIKSHLEYLSRMHQTRNPDLSAAIASFWTEYKRLMLALARGFPLVQLPSLVDPLEEDLDMRGFLPLRRDLQDLSAHDDAGIHDATRQEVHPNEEQLMRISDLLVDVKLLMQTEYGSVALNSGTPLPSAPFVTGPATDEAASVSVSTETEDDPVNLAMRATLTEGSSISDDQQEFDDDEEVILWGRSTPVVPDVPQLPHGATAQDLMQNLTLASAQAPGSNKQPHLLFGGDVAGTGSIWTMSREESQQGVHRGSGSRPVPPHIAGLWNDSPGTHHPHPNALAHQQQQPLANSLGGGSMWSAPPPPPPGLAQQQHLPPHQQHQRTPQYQQPHPQPQQPSQHLAYHHHQPPPPHMQHQTPPPHLPAPPGLSPSAWAPNAAVAPGPQSPYGSGSSRQSPSNLWPGAPVGGNTWGLPGGAYAAPRPTTGPQAQAQWASPYQAP